MSNQPKPPVHVELTWDGGLRFSGRSGDAGLILDSDATAGPSPMQTLALALAGCMAMDVADIVRKGRHGLTSLKAELSGSRAAAAPRRFKKIDLHFTVGGRVPANAVERAIQLSRERYCSVWNSMRQDIKLNVTFEIKEDDG